MRVLIVDDSAVIRDRLRESLRDARGAVIVGEARDAVVRFRTEQEGSLSTGVH